MGIRASLCTFLLLTIALAPLANADTLNLSGNLTLPSLAATTVDFNGAVTSGSPATGVFAFITPGTPGILSDLSIATEPVGSAFSASPFGTISGFTFDLTSINAGTFSSSHCSDPAGPSNMAGDTCTPNLPGSYLSALNLQNTTATSSTLSFTFAGTATGPGLAAPSPFTGIISASFNESFQQFLHDYNTLGSTTFNFNATLDVAPAAAPAVPEPSSLLLLGTGLAALAGTFKRKLGKY